MTFRRLFLTLFLTAGIFAGSGVQAAVPPTVHLFWAEGCPHCTAEKSFLPSLAANFPGLDIRHYEVSANRENAELFRRVGEILGANFIGVPVTVVGQRHVIGFRDAETSGRAIDDLIRSVAASGEKDAVAIAQSSDFGHNEGMPASLDGATNGGTEPTDRNDVRSDAQGVPDEVNLPLIGPVRLQEVSLPAFTVVLALLDGFNPCAMWVLLFLLSLLVGMPNRKRAWIFGSSFLLASGLMYFLFLSAWLNAFRFLGLVPWVRLAVGVVALAAGIHYLHGFFFNRRGGCNIVNDRLRDRIFAVARTAIAKKSLTLGIVGIVILAFAVNLVELACSAGLPAVYTHVLSGHPLSDWQYHSYLALYVTVFLIDDLFVFFTALAFLQLTGIQHKYTHCARLVGGLLMLAIGLLLFFRPDWLSFG